MSQLLISQEYLRKKSIINDNVDYELITPIIVTAQDLKIEPMLGTKLYNRVIFETTPTAPGVYANLSPAIQYLMDNHITPTLLQWVQCMSVVPFKFRFMNKGIMENNSANSQPSSTDDIKFLKQELENIAENYTNKCIKYIAANLPDYPEYSTNSSTDGDTYPDKRPFKSPFYTGEDCDYYHHRRYER